MRCFPFIFVVHVSLILHVFRTRCRSDKRQAVDDEDDEGGDDPDAMEL